MEHSASAPIAEDATRRLASGQRRNISAVGSAARMHDGIDFSSGPATASYGPSVTRSSGEPGTGLWAADRGLGEETITGARRSTAGRLYAHEGP